MAISPPCSMRKATGGMNSRSEAGYSRRQMHAALVRPHDMLATVPNGCLSARHAEYRRLGTIHLRNTPIANEILLARELKRSQATNPFAA
jgi:hypothetical protein